MTRTESLAISIASLSDEYCRELLEEIAIHKPDIVEDILSNHGLLRSEERNTGR